MPRRGLFRTDTTRGPKNKVIVITGGCGDIGGATALKLSELGGAVVLFDILDHDAGSARAKQLGATAYMRVDQRKTQELRRGIADVCRQFGRIDVAIGNARVGPGGNLLELEDSEWESVLQMNLIGCAQFAQAAIRHMISQEPDRANIRGKVLFTSSWVGDFPSPGAIPYCVSKAGLNHLVRLAAQEFAANGSWSAP